MHAPHLGGRDGQAGHAPAMPDLVLDHLPTPQLQILLAGARSQLRWSGTFLRPVNAHFWHLYWNASAGAEIQCATGTISLDAGFLVAIPPGCWFTRRDQRPVDHLFLHVAAPTTATSPRLLPATGILGEAVRTARDRLLAGDADHPALAWAVHLIALAGTVPAGETPTRPFADLLAWWDSMDWGAYPVVELARRCGMPVRSFARAFQAACGRAPLAFARERRLERAARLLAEGEADLDAVAACAGCCDRSHLSRLFTRRFGVAPSEYRRRIRLGTGLGSRL